MPTNPGTALYRCMKNKTVRISEGPYHCGVLFHRQSGFTLTYLSRYGIAGEEKELVPVLPYFSPGSAG